MSDLLSTMARRIRKVDLLVIDEIRQMWPSIVGEVVAQHCQPELVKNGVLLVAVPSGAFAQRLLEDHDVIIAGFAPLGSRAPSSLRPLITNTP
jgi:predicted nucleic acid-binding Zn ribbon protein